MTPENATIVSGSGLAASHLLNVTRYFIWRILAYYTKYSRTFASSARGL
jgi:hypothetical protein